MLRVAFTHDWLVTAGGGENVLSEALKAFPDAPVHALLDKMSASDHERLSIPQAHTSWLQHVPGIERSYRSWLAMMPTAMRSIDLGASNTIVAISHAVAKAPRVRPQQRLLCYCLSPMRYAWDLRDQYLSESGLDHGPKGMMARALLDYMQGWDKATSSRVDAYASISHYIADRVKRAYGRDSEVIYPPVDTDYFTPGRELTAGSRQLAAENLQLSAPSSQPPADSYYVTASRFVPYKRIDLIVRAFAANGHRLVVIGDGPDNAKVHAAAAGAANITFAGHANRELLRTHLRGARAFIFAAEEDFGIAPVEAQACGTPVIAYGKGGALETVVPLGADGATGLFFNEQTVESLNTAVARFETESSAIDSTDCVRNAVRFSSARFRKEFAAWVQLAAMK